MKQLSGIILAGGLSSRMGRDKGLLPHKGRLLVEYSIEVMKTLCSEIIISSNNSAYEQFGHRVVKDIHQQTGPIGGLYAALSASNTNDAIICPCDMPFISADTFHQLLKVNNRAVVVQSNTDKLYPTLGYYNKSCLPTILQQIEQGNYKMQCLIKELNAHSVKIDDARSLLNFNSPEDIR